MASSRTVFLGTGHYLPDNVVTNAQLAARMDTSDEWIRQRAPDDDGHRGVEVRAPNLVLDRDGNLLVGSQQAGHRIRCPGFGR